jgi:hypothetical protein
VDGRITIAYNERADETTALAVGGARDRGAVNLSYQIAKREYVSGELYGARYYTQDRTFIGSGEGLIWEAGHRFRTEYPDWHVRAAGSVNRFSQSGSGDIGTSSLTLDGSITDGRVLPAAQLLRLRPVYRFRHVLSDQLYESDTAVHGCRREPQHRKRNGYQPSEDFPAASWGRTGLPPSFRSAAAAGAWTSLRVRLVCGTCICSIVFDMLSFKKEVTVRTLSIVLLAALALAGCKTTDTGNTSGAVIEKSAKW